MSRRLAKILQIVNIIVMMALMLVVGFAFKSKVAMYAVAGVACVIAIWLNSYLCCPHCGAWPRKGSFFHEYCPSCGRRLED